MAEKKFFATISDKNVQSYWKYETSNLGGTSMKKAIVLMLVSVFLFLAAGSTYGVTTLFIGKTFEGKGTSTDYSQSPIEDKSGDITNTEFNFTNISEIKKIKFDISYETGDFKYLSDTPTMELWNAQVGYPLVSHDKGLVYLTFGTANYNEYSDVYPKHEARSPMVGFNIIGTPTENFQFEIDVQHSIFHGSSTLYYSSGPTLDYSSPEMTAFKVKVQYNFSDILGFAIHYQSLNIRIDQLQVDAVDLNTASAGFIYRF
jgi:hypothetical protein